MFDRRVIAVERRLVLDERENAKRLVMMTRTGYVSGITRKPVSTTL